MKIKTAQNKLWKLVREYVIIRDNNRCQRCNKYVTGRQLNVSHVIGRGHGNRLKFDPMNLKVLCAGCHLNWWHQQPLEAGEWFIDKFPERAEYLRKHKNEIVRWRVLDYELFIEDMKEKIRLLTNVE